MKKNYRKTLRVLSILTLCLPRVLFAQENETTIKAPLVQYIGIDLAPAFHLINDKPPGFQLQYKRQVGKKIRSFAFGTKKKNMEGDVTQMIGNPSLYSTEMLDVNYSYNKNKFFVRGGMQRVIGQALDEKVQFIFGCELEAGKAHIEMTQHTMEYEGHWQQVDSITSTTTTAFSGNYLSIGIRPQYGMQINLSKRIVLGLEGGPLFRYCNLVSSSGDVEMYGEVLKEPIFELNFIQNFTIFYRFKSASITPQPL